MIAAVLLAAGVSIVHGPVNGVLIERGGETLAIYGDPRPQPARLKQVLFTHARRDVVWAGHGAEAVVPEAEKALFAAPGAFWERYWTGRFHDYASQSSRVPVEPVNVVRTVRGGDTVDWHGLKIGVLDTPGYTRGAVSYLFEADGKRIACVGDLIYGDGQVFDLYSLQDAIPGMWDGYHGYAARAADVMQSFEKIAAWKPDVLVPARGPVIRDPAAAIARLGERFRALFASHFATDALRWYSGDGKQRAMAARVLGMSPVEWMPTAELTDKLPSWVVPITNSRAIVSKTGDAFLVDCGNRKVVEEASRFRSVEGIFITHYHDDHTDMAQAASERFHCPVYFNREQLDILEHPGAYRMPCLTANAIRGGRAMEDGARQRWHEFEFTYYFFPGQTLYHGALEVKKDGGETVFFIGDSFSPTGMDDYCMLNRNFLGPEDGLLQCLRRVREHGNSLLINQHVPPAFRFSPRQIDFMLDTFGKRRGVVSALVPWDDPNFGVDEQWARFYPYGLETTAGARLELKVMLRNHSASPQTFRVAAHAPAGWKTPAGPLAVKVGAHEEGFVTIPVTAGGRGLGVVTADVAFGNWDLRRWTEALVMVK